MGVVRKRKSLKKDHGSHSFTVHDLPKPERPRERLMRLGEEALSAQELLALVIGRGIPKKSVMKIAQELISRFGNVKAISNATIEQLSEIIGIGPARAVQIKACFELGKRQRLDVEIEDIEIKCPKDIAKVIKVNLRDKTKEHFRLIILNNRNNIINISKVSTGTLTASLVHPREVFKEAIVHTAASVVLAHNHPSGNPEPSEDDLAMTRRLVEVGKILGIEVVDHVIITEKAYFSFKERGLL
ncbi:MAG: DNA repair protein RadC [bacterium]